MPADVVSGQDLEDVAAYVGMYAGVPGAAPPQVAGRARRPGLRRQRLRRLPHPRRRRSGGTTGPDLNEVLPGQTAKMIEESIVRTERENRQGLSRQRDAADLRPDADAKELEDLVQFLLESTSAGGSKSAGRLSRAAAAAADIIDGNDAALASKTASTSPRSATPRSPLVALGALAPIVLTGAGVRLTGSGLGCPDWPKCYGSAVPPLETHAVIEYGNRLFTGFVGIAVIAASVLAWFRRPFRWHLAFFGALLPLGVIGQAILGALVVKYHLAPGLVMGHFILSMLLLDAAFALAWCSRYEPGERRRSTTASASGRCARSSRSAS